MIDRRPFDTLGGADHGWLKAKHHFAFGGYRDSKRPGWGSLLVWNDDEIAPGTGFPAHPHRDMEIITYVREGAISHEDSTGNKGRTVAGDVQVMSAGSGIRHSEYNAEAETSRIFQIWIEPRAAGGAPGWGTKPFPRDDRTGKFVVLASGMPGDEDALRIRADGRVLAASVKAGETIEYRFATGRHGYLVPATGAVTVNDVRLDTRDGAAIHDETVLRITAIEDADLVLVDVD